MVSGREFLNVCNDREVGLAPEIRKALCHLSAFRNAHRFAPTLTLNGLVHAGVLLREKPGISLIQNRFEPPEDFVIDTPAQTLADVLNTSREHELEHPNAFKSQPTKEIGFCDVAEARFFITVQALASVKPSGATSYGAEIITNGGRPIILRKSGAAKSGNSTGLTLEETIINGVRFPAGSIVRVTTKPKPGETSLTHHVSRKKIEVSLKEDVQKIAFLRLSAFALMMHERNQRVMPVDSIELGRRERSRFARTKIKEIADRTSCAIAALDEDLIPS